MIPSWLFGSNAIRWESCMAHFDQHGMALPIVPDALEHALRSGLKVQASGSFATAGWRGHGRWQDLVDDWVRRPEPVRAWLGIAASRQEPVVEVSMVTPSLGVFMRHRWSRSQDDAMERLRVGEAHRSAAQLLWDAEKLVRLGRWPSGQRLLLIDDDLDLARWGWLDGASDPSDTVVPDIRVMKVSHSMYLEVMSVMDGLHHGTPEALVHRFLASSHRRDIPCKHP
ncbi:hypothetical protein [Hydrogenophaga sp. R2]|uniref:hypothetical protein n=1 Tax=Hydrogenophaga sp. R2 TaxID=3132827 RepID=UPI003CEBCF4C